ncbi:MAG: hypothetical protein F6K54_04885 [Okeania sp. SIO3B5]|uniref:hypothetical protein n=1 Tax=Okeania sp. SIO3B5 TaxID=2607811 RepID=UPI00140040B9|nr:hypothetical protein [Okeania sp. SIO3B5]NEO52466.1 hypothetical protein [Okeania sp. SIO3B5]
MANYTHNYQKFSELYFILAIYDLSQSSNLRDLYHVWLNTYTLEEGRQRAEGRRQKGILV